MTFFDALAYAGAIAILFATPGPVWVAIIARCLSGGKKAGYSFALGVAVLDIVWPLLALLGAGLIIRQFEGAMDVMRWGASVVLIVMGLFVIKNADRALTEQKMTVQGGWLSGMAAGIGVNIWNPKAVLFYLGLLPGFFDIEALSWGDIALICAISSSIPLVGNVFLSLSVDGVRALFASAKRQRQLQHVSGSLLIAVGVFLPVFS